MTPNDKIELTRQSKVLLGNKAFEEAYRLYREKCVEQLQAADPDNVALVLTLKRHLTTLAVVRKNLEMLIDDGALAQDQLDYERQTLAQRARNALRRVNG